MDRAVQKPFGLDSPRCNLSLLFQALVALSPNVPGIPDVSIPQGWRKTCSPGLPSLVASLVTEDMWVAPPQSSSSTAPCGKARVTCRLPQGLQGCNPVSFRFTEKYIIIHLLSLPPLLTLEKGYPNFEIISYVPITIS